jgi:hypothetical protein
MRSQPTEYKLCYAGKIVSFKKHALKSANPSFNALIQETTMLHSPSPKMAINVIIIRLGSREMA